MIETDIEEIMANQFLSLSLFLMLLSFFIVMNSVSAYEEKREAKVLKSIVLAFSNNEIEELSKAPEDTPNPIGSYNLGTTLDEVEGLFHSTISGFEMSRNRLGTVMHVRLPIAKFENAINMPANFSMTMGDGLKGSFIKTLVTILRAEERGQPYRIDMILNVEDDPIDLLKVNTIEFDKELYRVSSLSEQLQSNGVPTNMLSSGLVKGKPGYLDLYIHKYKPFKFPETQDANKGRGN